MINRITVSEKRGLFPEYGNLGTIGERNATTLLFLLPGALQGYGKNIVCVTSQGSFCYEVSNDTFDLPSEVLTDNTLSLQLVLKDGDRVIWKSVPYTFTLNPTLDDSGENPISKAKSEQQESDRTELGEALSVVTKDNEYKGIEWEKLIKDVGTLPIMDEENQLKLVNNRQVSFLFEHSVDAPSVLYSDYDVESLDDTYNEEFEAETGFIFPYLYTPAAKYSTKKKISAYLRYIAFDVSGVDSTFNSGATTTTMANCQWLQNGTVESIYLTGVQNIDRFWNLFAYSGVSAITLIKTGEKREDVEYQSDYYAAAFRNATNLQFISGTPFDFSEQPCCNSTFWNCGKLQYFRVKPRSIVSPLYIGNCSKLIYLNIGTVLSILNGCRDFVNALDTPVFTVYFNSLLQTDMQKESNYVYCNLETKDYIDRIDYNVLSDSEKNKYGKPVSLISAFTHPGIGYEDDNTTIKYYGKGVALSWQT